MRLIKGIVPVVLTPMNQKGEIDDTGLEKLLCFLLEKKIGGLWALGTGSEDMNLSFEKRLKVAQIISSTVAERIPVVLGAGFYAMEDILTFIHTTKDLEIDAYHVMPYHPLLSAKQLEWFYLNIADKSHKPIWMYTSGNWSLQLSIDAIKRLKDHPNIAGIKFSSTNSVNVLKVISLADDSFQVITAVASQLYPCLSMGTQAHTSSLGSCLPEPMIDIYELFKKGDHVEALDAQKELAGYLGKISSCAKKDNFIMAAEEKYILKMRGICDQYTSSYYRDISNDEIQYIQNILTEFGYMRYIS